MPPPQAPINTPAPPPARQLPKLPNHPPAPGTVLPSGNLIDPITAKERNIHHVPVDKLLDYNQLDHLSHDLKTLFVTLPKTVVKGLKGDPSFSFSDFMLISKIPYYMGGAVLAYSFLAGRDKPSFVRQGVGVMLYYAGVTLANRLVDFIYKQRYGVDLNQKYRRADGRVEKVFASADFARFDLLTPKHYQEMQEKMGIPPTVADRDQACREQLFRLISSSRAIKLVLGNVLAAIGAGYLARTDLWSRLLGRESTLGTIWRDPAGGGVLNRLNDTWVALKSFVGPALKEKIQGVPGEASPWLRKVTLGSLLGIGALCVYESLNGVKSKRFESSPITLIPRGENWLNDSSVFNRFLLMQEEGRRR